MINRETIKSHFTALCWLLTIPLLSTVYVYLNRHEAEAHSLVTDLDRQLPFLKIFIVPYVTWFIFIFAALVYLCIKDRHVYLQTLVCFNLGLIMCYCIYGIYQTYVPRPELTSNDWLTQLVQFVYSMDRPYNCFPSTHTLTSYCMIKAYRSAANISRPVRMVVSLMSILIIASTLFVKQHVLLDLIGAIVIIEVLYCTVSWLNSKAKGVRRAFLLGR